jgi:hypothetical protein
MGTESGIAAEDAVQDALVLAWRHWHALREPERAEAWLTRCPSPPACAPTWSAAPPGARP